MLLCAAAKAMSMVMPRVSVCRLSSLVLSSVQAASALMSAETREARHGFRLRL